MTDPTRDAKGRYLPGEAWRREHPRSVPALGGSFKRKQHRHHSKRCRHCGSLFLGFAKQLYCSKLCRGRAYELRCRAPQSLTPEQTKILPIFDRPKETGPLASTPWWQTPPSGRGILVPLTGLIEDRLNTLMRYKLYDVDLAVGGLIKQARKYRVLLGSTGEAMPATRHEILLHDLMVWGLNSALLLLKGQKPKINPRRLSELQRKMYGQVRNPGRSPRDPEET